MPATMTAASPRPALEISEAIAAVHVPESLEEILESAPQDVCERVGRILREAEAEGQDPGLVPLYVIRPGIGRGKGSHLYEADMLASNAHIFRGWRMYVDHLSEAARKALGGLPRSIRDLGGRIQETWWDPTVAADPQRGFGQGAVVGIARPVPYVKELIDNDSELIEASISARATGVHVRRVDGQTVNVVEGIEPKGSVDWVTEAGAGGRVVSLIESYYSGEEAATLLESLTDEDLLEHIQRERPDLAARLAEAGDGDGDGDGGDDAFEARVASLMQEKGLSRANAEDAARREMRQSSTQEDGGGDDVKITVADLREALSTDEGESLVGELLAPLVEERVEELLAERLPDKIEEALSEERELLSIEMRADAERQIQIRDMRDEAHRLLAESRLPVEFQQVARAKFDITETGPTPALDVLDELDADGSVIKKAEDILAEAVAAEIAHQRALLAAANPTRVHTPVAAQGGGDEGGGGGDEGKVTSTGSRRTDAILAEAGFDTSELDKVYG